MNLPLIAIAPVERALQPSDSPFVYPNNSQDWGVEQDFLEFLLHRYPRRTSDLSKADWVYLPVFWTRYHLWHGFGATGLLDLKAAVQPYRRYLKKSFTICQYDDGPLIDLGAARVFLSSRKGRFGYDAPLLSETDIEPVSNEGERRFFASFVGRFSTYDKRRLWLQDLHSDFGEVFIHDGHMDSAEYLGVLHRSDISLAPRGYGGSSFRFFEAIRAGSVPWLIGERDTRPFKDSLPWGRASFFSRNYAEFRAAFMAVTPEDVASRKLVLESEISPFFRLGGDWPWLVVRELQSHRERRAVFHYFNAWSARRFVLT